MIKGQLNQIRQNVSEEYDILIAGVLVKVSTQIGARELSAEMMSELLDYTRNHFGFLGVHEILEAFDLKTARKLDDEGVQLFYGDFNKEVLGKTLRAYSNKRREIVNEWMDLQAKEEEKKRVENLKQKFDLEYDVDLDIQFQMEQCKDWRDINLYPMYSKLVEQDRIKFNKGQKAKILERSKVIFEHEKETEKLMGVMKGKYKDAVKDIEKRKESRIIVIAKKLTIWKTIFNF